MKLSINDNGYSHYGNLIGYLLWNQFRIIVFTRKKNVYVLKGFLLLNWLILLWREKVDYELSNKESSIFFSLILLNMETPGVHVMSLLEKSPKIKMTFPINFALFILKWQNFDFKMSKSFIYNQITIFLNILNPKFLSLIQKCVKSNHNPIQISNLHKPPSLHMPSTNKNHESTQCIRNALTQMINVVRSLHSNSTQRNGQMCEFWVCTQTQSRATRAFISHSKHRIS